MADRPASPQALRVSGAVAVVVAFGAAVLAFAAGLAACTGPPDEPTVDSPRLGTGQTVVTGTFTRLAGTGVDGPTLGLPLTLVVARGGGTKASITNATVNGRPSAVAWDGGRPLPMSGEGGLDLNGPTDVELTARGVVWTLDGRPRGLVPGSYRLGATVAVGTSGIGTPRDGVVVDVAPGTTGVLSTNGGVTVTQKPAPLTLRGPGSLVLEGALDVQTSSDTAPASAVRFGPGPFELDVEPVPDRPGSWRITRSLFQGRVTPAG